MSLHVNRLLCPQVTGVPSGLRTIALHAQIRCRLEAALYKEPVSDSPASCPLPNLCVSGQTGGRSNVSQYPAGLCRGIRSQA